MEYQYNLGRVQIQYHTIQMVYCTVPIKTYVHVKFKSQMIEYRYYLCVIQIYLWKFLLQNTTYMRLILQNSDLVLGMYSRLFQGQLFNANIDF